MRARSVLRGFGVLGTALALAASFGAIPAQAALKVAPTRSAASQPLNPKPNLHIMPTRQSSQAAKRASGAVMAAGINLSYWGGPVMQAGTQTIPIFWQPATLQDGTGSAPAAGYDSLIQQFFTDIGGHGYYNIMNQYYQVVAAQKQYIVNSSGFLQAVVDTSPYPASTGDCATNAVVNCITDTQLQTEIASVITAGSLPKDYSTAYFVFTDPLEASCASPSQCFNPENYNSFAYCAYHGEFLLGGQPVIYANMPYVDSEFISNILCGAGLSATGNQDFDDESSPLSHEFMEMVTDPNADASGWYDFTNNNGEIGDICVGDARPVTWGAHSYIIQTEYSNGDVACVPGGSNQITLTSTGGAPGSATTVNGTGFTANHSVSLSFSDASGTVTSLGSTTSNGSGAISQLVTIPGGAPNGLGTLDAIGASPGDGASAGFTVSGSGPTTWVLTVSKSGSGTGGVTSSPAGIDCGATCHFSFNDGDSVTLTATADAGSTFTGWSGSGCSGTGTCTVAMTQTRGVTATFVANTFNLTVSRAGSGTGGVTSSPVGIDCGATCQFSFNNGDSVTLTATADAGSTFTGWSGSGCSGTGSCIVAMTQVRAVTATFGLSYRPDGQLSYNTGAFVGDNIYNTSGASQVRGVRIGRGRTAVFHWKVQNDGALTDQMLLSAPAGTATFTVRFFSGTTNVTAAVVAGTYARSLAPGASFTLTVKIGVTTSAAIGAVRSELLTAISNNAPVSDAVLARVTAK